MSINLYNIQQSVIFSVRTLLVAFPPFRPQLETSQLLFVFSSVLIFFKIISATFDVSFIPLNAGQANQQTKQNAPKPE